MDQHSSRSSKGRDHKVSIAFKIDMAYNAFKIDIPFLTCTKTIFCSCTKGSEKPQVTMVSDFEDFVP